MVVILLGEQGTAECHLTAYLLRYTPFRNSLHTSSLSQQERIVEENW
jgi:hypothetical protein